MKKIVFSLLLLALPLMAEARGPNSHVGLYGECARWTTFNGMKTSKKFDLELKEDDSITLTISFYRNTDTCESEDVELLVEYKNFRIIEDLGKGSVVRIVTVYDEVEKYYFKLMFLTDRVTANFSETLPIRASFANYFSLNRLR